MAAACRGIAGKIQLDRSEVAIEAHGFEKGIGHDEVAVRIGMESIRAANMVGFSQDRLGFAHRLPHRAVDIGMGESVIGGNLAGQSGEGLQVVVVLLCGCLFVACVLEAIGIDGSGTTYHHVFALGFQFLHDLPERAVVVLADGWLVGTILAIVHAITKGDDIRVKHREIRIHPFQESRDPLAVPAELKNLGLQVRLAGGKVKFHEPAVAPRLGDGIAHHSDAGVFWNNRLGGSRGRKRVKKKREG